MGIHSKNYENGTANMRSSKGGQGNHNVYTQIMELVVVYVYSFVILINSFSICFRAFLSLWNGWPSNMTTVLCGDPYAIEDIEQEGLANI